MKSLFCVLMFFSSLASSVNCFAQGYLKSDYLFSSSLKDKDGNKLGSGDLYRISGRYTLPLSVKQNNLGQISAWSATLNSTFGYFNNKNITREINPEKILNLNLNIAHLRPISEKWYLAASLGVGIYSEPDAITIKNLLANGGIIFFYKLMDNLDLGIGAGLTNSYGVPVIMPMSCIKWELTGKYEIKADIANGMEISAALRFNDKFRLKLVAMEMDGISSVMDLDGKSMIFASTIMKSYLAPEFRIGKKASFYAGAGSVWLRSVNLSKRSLKGFLGNFSNNDNLDFSATGYLTIGFRYGF